MLSRFNLPATEVLYFEHNKEAIESAESIGIKSYHYDNQARDLEALKKFIENSI